MSSAQKVTKTWEALRLQLIVFPVEPLKSLREGHWQNLTGEEPSETRRRKEERTDSGIVDNCALACTSDILKINWTLDPVVESDEAPENIPTVGEFRVISKTFNTLMMPWIENHCPPIKRIGFAAGLVQWVEDHKAGYSRLGGYLPAVQVDPNSFDFKYRINRKRQLAMAGEEIVVNRLNAWSVANFFIQLKAVHPRSSTQFPELESSHFGCLLDIDINSDNARTNLLPHESIPELFTKLIEIGAEISEMGDVP